MSDFGISRFIEHRAVALADVFLTGLLNVDVIDVEDLNVDKVAKILSDGKAERFFGIKVKGTVSPLGSAMVANKLLNARSGKPGRASTLPMPVVILLFTMKEDAGYFAWQVEPVVDRDVPRLKIHERYKCEIADDSALEFILGRVNQWYDALEESFYVSSSPAI